MAAMVVPIELCNNRNSNIILRDFHNVIYADLEIDTNQCYFLLKTQKRTARNVDYLLA